MLMLYSIVLTDCVQDDKRCSQALLLADKMHVMDTMYNVFINTWSDADCDSE